MRYYEYKYVIEPEQLSYAIALMESLHGGTDPFPAGMVHSVYYDTLPLAFYQQCVNGSERKTKYRIRWYDGGQVQAQIKEKDLFGVSKMKGALSLVSPSSNAQLPSFWHQLPFVMNQGDNAAIQARSATMGPLMPLLRVSYHRRRYRNFDFRMNIDSCISVEMAGRHPAGRVAKMMIPLAVMEIKTTQERPVLPFSSAMVLRQDSFSKYMVGIKLLTGESDVLNRYVTVEGVN